MPEGSILFPEQALDLPKGGTTTTALGRLTLIELCDGRAGLTPAERRALIAANVIVYERGLAPLVAEVLPLGGYAEAAPEEVAGRPVFDRCLRFALDGWNVVQLTASRGDRKRIRWVRDAAAQLAVAGIPGDTPVQVQADAPCGGPARLETPLRAAQKTVDDHGLTGGLTLSLGPIAAGPAPQIYAFAGNGLAG